MDTRSKLFLIGFAIFITTGVVVQSVDNCDEIASETNAAMKEIDTLMIEQIELYNTYPGHTKNLVEDTIIITETAAMFALHKMIAGRVSGTWNRPVSKWDVTMKIKLAGGSSVVWRIRRIANSKVDKLTHIYPGEKTGCYEASPRYSLLLGDYLEQLTGFTGKHVNE